MEGGGSVEAEAQLYELARTAGLEISPDMFAVVLDLLRLDVLPQGIIALLRALKDLRLRAPVAVAATLHGLEHPTHKRNDKYGNKATCTTGGLTALAQSG